MYIESLHVRNIKLLAEQEFSFVSSDGSPRMWTAIVGENGLCKTTILRAIALAAMGPKLGTALMNSDTRPLRNVNNEKDASITAQFTDLSPGYNPPPGKPDLVSSLLIRAGYYDLVPGEDRDGALFLDDVRAKREEGFFVTGYSIGRYLGEPERVSRLDPVLDRIKGLFDFRHSMRGINFSGAIGDVALAKVLSEYLSDVLREGDTPDERLLPGFLGMHPDANLESALFEFLMGESHLILPADWLSDGYKAMLSWVFDLLVHAMLDMPGGPDPRGALAARPDQQPGIVLLDEIDLHLHPTWQRRIVPLLRRIFPRLQFIVSTHSPLVLASFEREEIILLKLQDGQVIQDDAEIEPGILTASEILTNFFDVQRAGRPELVRKERRYLELRGIERPSEVQRREMMQLESELAPYWTAGPSDAELRSPEEILKRRA